MRKIICLISMAMACVSVCFASAGKCGNNVTWELEDGLLTFSGSGNMKNFSETPWNPRLVEKVVINDGITSIGENAFNGCKNLSEIVLPTSIETIQRKAFANCEQLLSIIIPYGVKTIEISAFENCKNLTYVRIASSVQRIGVDAFKGCFRLNEIRELPSCVTKQNCKLLGLNEIVVDKYLQNQGVQYAETSVQQGAEVEAVEVQRQRNNNVVVQSDVDLYIPENPTNNENTFVVIIANEDYNRLADVNFALNDGRVFAQYCNKTLGIPTSNIRKYEDATLGNMLEALADIKNIADAYKGNLKVIFYYCGHGAPDEKTEEAYLIPTDAFAVSARTCLSVSTLYEELGLMKTKSTTVFLDACFSGATRDDQMIAAARSVAIAPRSDRPSGNVAVLSASSGTETALQYDEKGHGMFTYYLLKKLQETKGNVSLGELSEYITNRVLQKSTVVNRKSQTPTMQVSPQVMNSWQNWQFKY